MANKAFEDSNVAKNVTEVTDAAGNLLWRVTREYGEKLPVNEAFVIESILFEAAKQAASELA